MSAIFLNDDEFSETITYYFRAGGSRSIKAIIDRDPPAFYDAGGNVVLPEFTIEIDNNCTTGIKTTEIDSGGDEVELFAKEGDTVAVRKTILKIQRHDMGAITLALK